MTPEEEQLAARLYAEGRSEREVAAELGISASSAHRLKLKLEAQQAGTGPAPEMTGPRPGDRPDAPVMLLERKPEEAAELAALAGMREQLAGQLETTMGRATASSSALQQLEAERAEVLAQGGDAVQLRQRLQDARADLDDWATSARLLSERLAATDARIAEIGARRDLEGRRAELAAAVAERDAVFARSGDRQRAAVRAVRAAAEDFVAVAAEEEAAVAGVAQLSSAVMQVALQLGEPGPAVPPPANTRLTAQGGSGGELALTRAMFQAGRGDVAAVARFLGEANGWLPPGPPSPAEQEQARLLAENRQQQLAAARSAAGPAAGPGVTDLDEGGRPIYTRAPHPRDVYGLGYADTLGHSYEPGYHLGY